MNDLIAHEMGHLIGIGIGIGRIWTRLSLLPGAGRANPRFTGRNAMRTFGELRGNGGPALVPVENTRRRGHRRDSVFGNEPMTGFVANPGNPLSRPTVACLQGMGYTVDMAAAEAYETMPICAKATALQSTAPRP